MSSTGQHIPLETPLRFVHLSDLHFATPSLRLQDFLSKRWIGNLNAIISRKNEFITERLNPLVDFFKKLQVGYVVISGDLSTTSHEKEFVKAQEFVKNLSAEKMQVFTLPGNHDHYTKKAFKQRLFYDYFETAPTEQLDSSFNLKEHGVSMNFLGKNWWLACLDTSLATSLISSRGCFSQELEMRLEEALSSVPSDHKIMMANHFPFFNHDNPRKMLVGGKRLQKLLLRYPNVKLYLHGHTHRHCLADLRVSGLPIILDSGSTTHRELGTWNLIEISPSQCTVQVFKWNPLASPPWELSKQASFKW